MSWQDDFHEALYDYIVTHGYLVREGDDFYLAQDYSTELPEHLETCPFLLPGCSYRDAGWREFAGSFAESDSYRHGIEAVITCECRFTDARRWRLENANYADILKVITR